MFSTYGFMLLVVVVAVTWFKVDEYINDRKEFKKSVLFLEREYGYTEKQAIDALSSVKEK